MEYRITEAQINQLETVRAQLEIFASLTEHITQRNITFSASAFLDTVSHLQEQLQYTLNDVTMRRA
jgi:molybdopterin converting factor small subunit